MGQLENAEAAVQQARSEGRWADASEELDRWLWTSRQLADTASTDRPAVTMQASPRMWTGALKLGRGKSGVGGGPLRMSADEEEGSGGSSSRSSVVSAHIKDSVPRIQKLLDSKSRERLTYVAPANKKNEHGKVQARILAVTDSAIYNLSKDGSKIKRRIPLEAVASVTLNEQTGQFVLHMPSEYDYLLNATHSGVAVGPDGSTMEPRVSSVSPHKRTGLASTHVINALQAAYTYYKGAPLPVRTFRGTGALDEISQVVQRKGHGGSTGDLSGRYDENDDDSD